MCAFVYELSNTKLWYDVRMIIVFNHHYNIYLTHHLSYFVVFQKYLTEYVLLTECPYFMYRNIYNFRTNGALNRTFNYKYTCS